jgi:hypothetical protein
MGLVNDYTQMREAAQLRPNKFKMSDLQLAAAEEYAANQGKRNRLSELNLTAAERANTVAGLQPVVLRNLGKFKKGGDMGVDAKGNVAFTDGVAGDLKEIFDPATNTTKVVEIPSSFISGREETANYNSAQAKAAADAEKRRLDAANTAADTAKKQAEADKITRDFQNQFKGAEVVKGTDAKTGFLRLVAVGADGKTLGSEVVDGVYAIGEKPDFLETMVREKAAKEAAGSDKGRGGIFGWFGGGGEDEPTVAEVAAGGRMPVSPLLVGAGAPAAPVTTTAPVVVPNPTLAAVNDLVNANTDQGVNMRGFGGMSGKRETEGSKARENANLFDAIKKQEVTKEKLAKTSERINELRDKLARVEAERIASAERRGIPVTQLSKAGPMSRQIESEIRALEGKQAALSDELANLGNIGKKK